MIERTEKICPRCGAMKLKPLRGLTDEELDMFERLSGPVDDSRHSNRDVCTNCWFSSDQKSNLPA